MEWNVVTLDQKFNIILKEYGKRKYYIIPLDHISAYEFKSYDRVKTILEKVDDTGYDFRIDNHIVHFDTMDFDTQKAIDALVTFVTIGNEHTVGTKKCVIKDLLKKEHEFF